MRVFVYFNLHRKRWSIKALEGENKGRVIGHAYSVRLSDVSPKVSEAGRQRVLREKRKNVHAGLVGELSSVSRESTLWREFPFYGDVEVTSGLSVTYNPYRFETFVSVENNNQALKRADFALMSSNGRVDVTCWNAETYDFEASKQLDIFEQH